MTTVFFIKLSLIKIYLSTYLYSPCDLAHTFEVIQGYSRSSYEIKRKLNGNSITSVCRLHFFWKIGDRANSLWLFTRNDISKLHGASRGFSAIADLVVFLFFFHLTLIYNACCRRRLIVTDGQTVWSSITNSALRIRPQTFNAPDRK